MDGGIDSFINLRRAGIVHIPGGENRQIPESPEGGDGPKVGRCLLAGIAVGNVHAACSYVQHMLASAEAFATVPVIGKGDIEK